jgi:hypothetical protein
MTTAAFIQSHTRNLEETLVYKRAALVCIGLIAVGVILYAYALCSTIHFVIARGSSQKEAQELSAHIGTLQVEYLAKAQSINLNTGASLGLHEANKISFVSRGASAVSKLSFAAPHEF